MTFLRWEESKGNIVVISLTELGMVIDDILVHQNASQPIFSNPSLRVTWDRLEHS